MSLNSPQSESATVKVITSDYLLHLIFENFVNFNGKDIKSIYQQTPIRYDWAPSHFHADFAGSIYPLTFVRLATVSKQFHVIATPFLYRYIKFYSSGYGGDKTTEKLHILRQALLSNPIYCQVAVSFTFLDTEAILTGYGMRCFFSIIHLLPRLKNLALPTGTRITEVASVLRNLPCLEYLEYFLECLHRPSEEDASKVADIVGADNFGLSRLYIINNIDGTGHPFFDKCTVTLLERLPRLTMLTVVEIGKEPFGILSKRALQNIANIETLRIGESSSDFMNSMLNVAALRCTNLKRLVLRNALDLSDLTLLALAEHQKDSLTEIEMTNVRTIGPLGFRKLVTSSTNLSTLIVVNNSLDLSLLVDLSHAGFRNENLRTLELGHKDQPITHQTFAAIIDIFPRVTSLTVVIVEIAGHVAVPEAIAALPLEMLDMWVELQVESVATPKDMWLVEDVGKQFVGLKAITLGMMKMIRCSGGWRTVVGSETKESRMKSESFIPRIWMYRLQEESEEKAAVGIKEDL